MKNLDVDEEAENLLELIERKYPPKKCSLQTYQDILIALQPVLKRRIQWLDEELENHPK